MNMDKLYKLYEDEIKDLEINQGKYEKSDVIFKSIADILAINKIINAFDNENNEDCIKFKKIQDKLMRIKESVM